MSVFHLQHKDSDMPHAEEIQAVLRQCLEYPGVYGVILSTIDGNALEQVLKRDISADRIATMNSSLLALAETLTQETQQQQNRFVILENSDGRIVSLRVNRTLLMTAISYHDSNLGMVLKISQNTANTLASLISEES
ncbi:MAG: roadblock/LC7 domain-containing protein [Gammaproteobacteria bacterium]